MPGVPGLEVQPAERSMKFVRRCPAANNDDVHDGSPSARRMGSLWDQSHSQHEGPGGGKPGLT